MGIRGLGKTGTRKGAIDGRKRRSGGGVPQEVPAAGHPISWWVLPSTTGAISITSVDRVENPANYALLSNEVYNVENLDLLPSFCFYMAFPFKVKGGSGSPVRAVALVPKEQ